MSLLCVAGFESILLLGSNNYTHPVSHATRSHCHSVLLLPALPRSLHCLSSSTLPVTLALLASLPALHCTPSIPSTRFASTPVPAPIIFNLPVSWTAPHKRHKGAGEPLVTQRVGSGM